MQAKLAGFHAPSPPPSNTPLRMLAAPLRGRPIAAALRSVTAPPPRFAGTPQGMERAIQPAMAGGVAPPAVAWPAQISAGQRSGGPAATIQRVPAYRVGTGSSNYKIEIDGGKIKGYHGGRSGIDISFGATDHADQYFASKKADPEARLVQWEFPDKLYEMIKARIKHTGGGRLPKSWKNDAMWEAVNKISAPVPTSDPLAPNKEDAPHFGREWIDILNKYAVGMKASAYTYEQWTGEDGGGNDVIAIDPDPIGVWLDGGEGVARGTAAEAETEKYGWMTIEAFQIAHPNVDIEELPLMKPEGD